MLFTFARIRNFYCQSVMSPCNNSVNKRLALCKLIFENVTLPLTAKRFPFTSSKKLNQMCIGRDYSASYQFGIFFPSVITKLNAPLVSSSTIKTFSQQEILQQSFQKPFVLPKIYKYFVGGTSHRQKRTTSIGINTFDKKFVTSYMIAPEIFPNAQEKTSVGV
jgi:hypothetical protein